MEEEIFSEHEFNSKELVKVEPEIKTAVEQAVSMVWNKMHGGPETFNVVYATCFTDPDTGKRINHSAEYNPDNDTLTIALDTMKQKYGAVIPNDEIAFILSAHETVHKVQFTRPGEKPKPSYEMTEMQYYDDKHEAEAWAEAFDAYKKFRPNVKGGITIGNRSFTIPHESSY
jgi:hypothetical protein